MEPYFAYITDYGTVRVSPDEYRKLEFAEELRSRGNVPEMAKSFLARVDTLKAACERVAKWRLDHG